MKFRITTAVALVAVLVAAFAAVAGAATESTITGTMTSFKYKAAAKTGKLHIVSKGKKTTIALNAKTNCGVSHGQSGDEVPCKTLGKYAGKPFRVTAKRYSDGHRVASVVGVDLSK
jgi:cytochrome c553